MKPVNKPKPRPDVAVGDEVYFHHKDGPQAAPVAATGKHGITVKHAGAHCQVKWAHVLGHKKRAEQKYDVLDEGEDGLIVKDAAGQRRYLAVPPDARADKMVLGKSFGPEGSVGRLVTLNRIKK